jgi:hypothetical protein
MDARIDQVRGKIMSQFGYIPVSIDKELGHIESLKVRPFESL